MEPNGFTVPADNGSAGVAHVALIRASGLTGAQYDPVGKRYVSLSVAGKDGFRECWFREGSASYREVWGENGKPLVVHELIFQPRGGDDPGSSFVDELIRSAPEGVAALIKTETGKVLLAGYSERFGTQQALRPESAEGTTGRQPGDFSGETLRLVSRDTGRALPFTGEVPWAAADDTL